MHLPSFKPRAALFALPLILAGGIASADEPSWYGGGTGSLVIQDNSNATGGVNFNNDDDSGYGLGGIAGYDLGNGFRAEGELGYQKSNLKNGTGDTSALYGLASGYYDFDIGQPFTPYVGAGLGYANTRLNATPIGAAAVDDSDTVPVWQLTAGVGYDLSPQTTLFAAYRYMAAIDNPSYTNSVGQTFDTDYANQNVMAGVRFKF